jgi:hypothetical protein
MNRTAEDARYRPATGDSFVYHEGPRSSEHVLYVIDGRVWFTARYDNPALDIEDHESVDAWAAHPAAGVWVPA